MPKETDKLNHAAVAMKVTNTFVVCMMPVLETLIDHPERDKLLGEEVSKHLMFFFGETLEGRALEEFTMKVFAYIQLPPELMMTEVPKMFETFSLIPRILTDYAPDMTGGAAGGSLH